ncbi:2Fe-2S iron-sulfur cluster-binding protein [Herbaspirillum sp. SJZ099]|uniref:2Fe-2S iron-sulfur cluster-binding protein n=1 Tax=Herbaspirillum sp. SJZ099 TaxID=2572916 RepID=UPI0011AA33C1|nr:2Fe-2S iron-sulfur cluster-binding protein [Herbaspirillum sp. SJZ099]TWC63235.1 ferredoxin [Herbaspirillum sp. SJZ099]
MPPATPYCIDIQPAGLRFEQRPGLSLLQSALAQFIRIPSSCRNGTCRTCMCQLKSGEISYQIEWPGLSKEEKKEGWILPCVAQAQTDLVLEVPLAVDLKE